MDGISSKLTGVFGISPKEISQAYGNEFIAGVAELPIDIYTSKLGGKVVKLLIGAGLVGGNYFVGNKLSGRSKVDLHEIAAHMFNRAADPSLGDIKEMQDDLINTLDTLNQPEATMTEALGGMVMENSGKRKQEAKEVKKNNERLKQRLPDWAPFSKSNPVEPNEPRESVESNTSPTSAIKRAMSGLTEAQALSEEDEIGMRGGF